MSKKIGNIYDKAIDFYKLKEAYERTSKNILWNVFRR